MRRLNPSQLSGPRSARSRRSISQTPACPTRLPRRPSNWDRSILAAWACFASLLLFFVSSALWAVQSKKARERQPMAGTVVRSKEYVVHRGAHEIEEFIGDVSYRQGLREMRADWAQFDRDQGQWNARGNIIAKGRLDDGSAVEAKGDLAHYDTIHKDGWLVGKDAGSLMSYRFFVIPSTSASAAQIAQGQAFPSTMTATETQILVERDRGTARRMEWDDASSEIRLKGDVHMLGDDGELWSNETAWNHDKSEMHSRGNVRSVRPDGSSWSQDAVYYKHDRRTVFTGRRPVLTRQDAKSSMAIQGEVIVADQDPERLNADGQVKGWLWFVKDKPSKTKKPNPHG